MKKGDRLIVEYKLLNGAYEEREKNDHSAIARARALANATGRIYAVVRVVEIVVPDEDGGQNE